MRLIRELFESTILRYFGVGGTAFVVDFGATVLARDYLMMPLWLAVTIGITAGFVVNFTLQRNFAFQSDRPYVWSVVLYFLLVAFNWAATTVGMYAIVEWLGYPTAAGKLLCAIATTLWNYPLYRFVVFPPKKEPVKLHPAAPLPSSVDFVIPAYNSAEVLEKTVADLAEWSRKTNLSTRVLIVENGSTDDTWKLAQTLARVPRHEGVRVLAERSDKGLGRAYRRGIELSTADLVVLSADDLPFGTSDIDAWLLAPVDGLAIGSKAHPDSLVERGFLRSVASFGFRFLRGMILHSRVGDPQGTLLCYGPWIREVAPHCVENGYLTSTEIVAIAEAQALPVVELPVTLTERQGDHDTRIEFGDIVQMARGLFHIRQHSDTVVQHLMAK